MKFILFNCANDFDKVSHRRHCRTSVTGQRQLMFCQNSLTFEVLTLIIRQKLIHS